MMVSFCKVRHAGGGRRSLISSELITFFQEVIQLLKVPLEAIDTL